MFTKKFYIVSTTTNLRDVKIEKIYDGDVFDLTTILAGWEKKLQGLNTQVAVLGDNAFIDIVNSDGELKQTYSIISQEAFVKKPY